MTNVTNANRVGSVTRTRGNDLPLRLVHLASGDLWAGAESQLYQLLVALARTNRVAILALLLNQGELAERLRKAGIQTIVIPEAENGELQLLLKVYRKVRAFQPDIVHTHRLKENVLGAIAARLAGVRASCRTIHGASEHSFTKWDLARSARVAMDTAVARASQDAIIAVSTDLASKVSSRFGKSKVHTILNGIDAEYIRSAATPRVALQKETHHIAIVGRLVPVKRVDLFLAAAAQCLSESGAPFQFHVIGDGPERGALVRIAQDLQINQSCHFYGHQDNCLPLLAAMDCLVLTSDHEGLPMVALEALALSVPVVAHAVGGLVDLLLNQPSCRLVWSQDVSSIAAAIQEACSDPGIAALPEEFSISRSVCEHLALYAQIAGGD